MFKTGYLETGMIIHSSKASESSEAVSRHEILGLVKVPMKKQMKLKLKTGRPDSFQH